MQKLLAQISTEAILRLGRNTTPKHNVLAVREGSAGITGVPAGARRRKGLLPSEAEGIPAVLRLAVNFYLPSADGGGGGKGESARARDRASAQAMPKTVRAPQPACVESDDGQFEVDFAVYASLEQETPGTIRELNASEVRGWSRQRSAELMRTSSTSRPRRSERSQPEGRMGFDTGDPSKPSLIWALPEPGICFPMVKSTAT